MTANSLPTRETLETAADCLRTLGHPIRLEMLFLVEQDDYNVGQLAECCGVSSHLASEHLRLMERCGLLSRSRVGKETFYRVAEPKVRNILACVVSQEDDDNRRR